MPGGGHPWGPRSPPRRGSGSSPFQDPQGFPFHPFGKMRAYPLDGKTGPGRVFQGFGGGTGLKSVGYSSDMETDLPSRNPEPPLHNLKGMIFFLSVWTRNFRVSGQIFGKMTRPINPWKVSNKEGFKFEVASKIGRA